LHFASAPSPNKAAWLKARPIAHRGLHDAAHGVTENSFAAARAAIEKNYAIECDVQLSLDGEAIVFHDRTLARLIGVAGEIGSLTAQELTRLAYPGAQDHIATLGSFLALIGGRVPLIVELKSRFDADMRLAARVTSLIADYAAPLALMSFDPQMLMALREMKIAHPLGLVAQARYAASEWPELSVARRADLARPATVWEAKPDFLAWKVEDLPHLTPLMYRGGFGLPVLAWTVRNSAQSAAARRFVDQIIFEGFEAEL
jgi:glycerophosphoryl diester phosphodiesterase